MKGIRIERKLKFKKTLLLSAIVTSPLIAFADVKQNSAEESAIFAPNQKIEQNLVEKDLIHLHNEGAISTKDAERLINKISEEPTRIKNSSSKNNSKNIQNTNSENTPKINIELFESDSLFKLNLINVNRIIRSEISKNNSGWQIIMQFPENKELNTSEFPINSYDALDFKITKFNEKTYLLNIIDNKNYISKKPIINKSKNKNISIHIPIKSKRNSEFSFPFLERFRKKNDVYNNKNTAVAPPLGDIASGSVVLKNRGFIKLDGPNVSLTLNNSSAKNALMRLTRLGGYGLVLANEPTNLQSNSTSSSGELNDGPYITLSFVNEDYSIAFNSILLASGLQAKKNDNLIIVGKNVLGKSFGPKLSKVYRLNQSSAASAADYLATLGASISKVDTVTTSTSGGASENSAPIKFIDSYSATTGPLIGLTGTTDSRLQTITLVGSSELITIAEKYLKQLDLRQRQVALSVKILNVDLSNDDSLSNDSAFRSGSTFIVSEKGKLFTAFGNFIPPALSTTKPQEERTYSQQSSIENGIEDGKSTSTTSDTSTIANTLTTSLIPNPGWQYTANELYNFLVAQITSNKTKVLANPTLILSESSEKIEGGAEIVGDMNSGQATIGRPFANESFVTVGKNVITDYKTSQSDEGGKTTCEAVFSTAGLTFGARVNKIDDNGFVTFSLSPELTQVSQIVDIPNCGPINILSVKRLDTGTLRVKDSQTLILTGVISNSDSETITKTPILGDIPILGRLFKSTAGSKTKSELIILVTPKIIDDGYPENQTKMGIGINPTSDESMRIIEESL